MNAVEQRIVATVLLALQRKWSSPAWLLTVRTPAFDRREGVTVKDMSLTKFDTVRK